MEMQLDHASFDSWLRGSVLVDYDAGTFVVVVRSPYACTQIQQRLYRSLKRILSDVYGSSAEIRFLTMDEWAELEPVRDEIGAA